MVPSPTVSLVIYAKKLTVKEIVWPNRLIFFLLSKKMTIDHPLSIETHSFKVHTEKLAFRELWCLDQSWWHFENVCCFLRSWMETCFWLKVSNSLSDIKYVRIGRCKLNPKLLYIDISGHSYFMSQNWANYPPKMCEVLKAIKAVDIW